MKRPDIDPSALLRSIQSEEKKYSHLTSIETLSQTPKQIDNLISAGKIIMANQLPQLRREIKHLLKREYRPCPQITDLDKNYCWPFFWEEINIFDLPMHVRVEQLREVEKIIAQPNAARIFWRARKALEVLDEQRQNFGHFDPKLLPLTVAAKMLLNAYADQKLKDILPYENNINNQIAENQIAEFISELNAILFGFAEPVNERKEKILKPPSQDQNANVSLKSYRDLIRQIEVIENKYIDFFKGELKADAEYHCKLHQFLINVKSAQDLSNVKAESNLSYGLHSECKDFNSDNQKEFYPGQVYADTVINLAKTLGSCEAERNFDQLGYCFAVTGNLTYSLAKLEERMATIESKRITDGLEPLANLKQIIKINGHWDEAEKLKKHAENMFADGHEPKKIGAFWVEPFLNYQAAKDNESKGYNTRANHLSIANRAFEYKATLCSKENKVSDELQQLHTWYIQQLIKIQMASFNNFAYVSALYGHTTPQVVTAAKAMAEGREDILTARLDSHTIPLAIEASTSKIKSRGDLFGGHKENEKSPSRPDPNTINVECDLRITEINGDPEDIQKDKDDALSRNANFLDTYGFVQFVDGNQNLLKAFFDDEQKTCTNEGNILDKQKEILLNVTSGISQYRQALDTVTDPSLEKKIADNFRNALALVGPVIEALNVNKNNVGTERQRRCLFDES